MDKIMRQRRTDNNGETIFAYFIDATRAVVYHYPDEQTLFSGATDRKVGSAESVASIRAALKLA